MPLAFLPRLEGLARRAILARPLGSGRPRNDASRGVVLGHSDVRHEMTDSTLTSLLTLDVAHPRSPSPSETKHAKTNPPAHPPHPGCCAPVGRLGRADRDGPLRPPLPPRASPRTAAQEGAPPGRTSLEAEEAGSRQAQAEGQLGTPG